MHRASCKCQPSPFCAALCCELPSVVLVEFVWCFFVCCVIPCLRSDLTVKFGKAHRVTALSSSLYRLVSGPSIHPNINSFYCAGAATKECSGSVRNRGAGNNSSGHKWNVHMFLATTAKLSLFLGKITTNLQFSFKLLRMFLCLRQNARARRDGNEGALASATSRSLSLDTLRIPC